VSGDGSTGLCLLIVLHTKNIHEINTDHEAKYLVCNMRNVNTALPERGHRFSVLSSPRSSALLSLEKRTKKRKLLTFQHELQHTWYSINCYKDHIDWHVLNFN
jgi:hypothetical protein